jgi:hypothetical protein
VAFGAGILAFLLIADGNGRADEPCVPLIQHKCGTCHFVNYICPPIQKGKGSFYWRGIVKDMVKEGMAATDQEQKRLTSCLASPGSEVKGLCPIP